MFTIFPHIGIYKIERPQRPRSHWTPHWCPNSRKGRSRPRKGDQRAIKEKEAPVGTRGRSGSDRAILILLGSRIQAGSDRRFGLIVIKSLVGTQRAIRPHNLLAKQCSFEPTTVPKKEDQCAIILKWECDRSFTPATNLVVGSWSRNCGSNGNTV